MANGQTPNIYVGPANQQGPAVSTGPIPGHVPYYLGTQPAPDVLPYYNIKTAQITGWVQFGCAVASVLLGILAVFFRYGPGWGCGLWSGVLFFGPTGLLGFFSRNRNRCLVIAYMVMSIVSSVVAGGCILIYIDGVTYSRYYYGGIVLNSIGIVVALAELVTSIVAAAFCCAGQGCCGNNCCGPSMPYDNSGNVMHYQPNGFANVMQYSGPPSYNASQQTNATGPPSFGANGFVVQPMPQMQPYVFQPNAVPAGQQSNQIQTARPK